MIKLKKSHNVSFTSIPSLIALLSLLCSLSGLFLPYLYSHTQNAGWSLIHIMKYNYTTVNVCIILLIFLIVLLYLLNIFIEPSWTSYFICATLSVVLCVAPTFIYYTLLTKVALIKANLTLHAGAVLMIVASLTFAGLEIYRLGTIEKKLSQRLILKTKNRLKKVYRLKKSQYKADAILNKVAQDVAREKAIKNSATILDDNGKNKTNKKINSKTNKTDKKTTNTVNKTDKKTTNTANKTSRKKTSVIIK